MCIFDEEKSYDCLGESDFNLQLTSEDAIIYSQDKKDEEDQNFSNLQAIHEQAKYNCRNFLYHEDYEEIYLHELNKLLDE